MISAQFHRHRDISDIFTSESRNVFQLFAENGLGFYIPAYQRPYSWGKNHIQKLIEDTIHGLRLLSEDKYDAVTFIGTLILIKDTKYETIEPHIQGQLPASVMLVIDGQQRLVTILLLGTLLHQKIAQWSRFFQSKTLSNPSNDWIYNQCLELMADLEYTFQEKYRSGDEAYRLYPKMVRTYDDAWSRYKKDAKYTSPIAHYLHSYSTFIHKENQNPESKFEFDYTYPTDSKDLNHYKLLKDNRNDIEKIIVKMVKPNNDYDFPELKQITSGKTLQNILMKSDFPLEVLERLNRMAAEPTKEDSRFLELLKLVMFTRYALERVAFNIVKAKNEEYAFDMFESLNTTGVPLTAFETFKPLVIRAEGLQHYENSMARQHVTWIEEYISQFKSEEEKQKATSTLIISFALAESGKKLSSRLSEQRKYLKESFDKKISVDSERLAYIHNFATIAQFMYHIWPEDRNKESALYTQPNQPNQLVLLCLRLLREAKHTITVAPLSRFYGSLMGDNKPTSSLPEFEAAIKAITAFFVLWRCSRRSTDRIDGYYRTLMEQGFADVNIPHLARHQGGSATVENLKAALRHVLLTKGNMTGKADWVRLSQPMPLYAISNPLTKFVLFVAAQDTVPDPQFPGLPKAAREGTLQMLNLENWKSESLTIEHIAPQSKPKTGWREDIYINEELIDSIGNLTLITQYTNSSVGNKPWAFKRLIYQALSADTLDTLSEKLSQIKAGGLTITQNNEAILQKSKSLPHVKAISGVEQEWSADLIQKRGERILDIAWDRLAPWLGL